MEKFPEDSYYLQCMKTVLDAYPQHSPPLHPSRLTDQFYIGNQDNADDVNLLMSLEITHVLNCAGTRTFDLTRSPYPATSGIKGFLMIPAQDYDEYNILKHFDDAIGFLDSAILNGGKALVHCSIGVNRSGAVAAAYLMISQRKRLMDVIVDLKAKRLLILCNMGFRKQLVQFARFHGLLDRVENHAISRQSRSFEESSVHETKEKSGSEQDKNESGKEQTESTDVIETKNSEMKEENTENNLQDKKTEHGITNHDSSKAEETNAWPVDDLFPKKYVYKTRAHLTSDIAKPIDTKPSAANSTRNFKNVDPDVLVKVINDSYKKYKRTNDMKTSLDNLTKNYSGTKRESFKSKSSENELTKEVESFLAANKKLTENRSDVGNLLKSLISKEDERIIWGKGSLENGQNFQNKTETMPASSTSRGTKDVSIKNYQDTTTSNIFKNLKELADSPSRKNLTTRSTSLRSTSSYKPVNVKKHNHELDFEIENYLKIDQTAGRALPTKTLSGTTIKEPATDVLKRISSTGSSTHTKPISFYKLQVMTEKESNDPDLKRETRKFLSSTNGHVGF